MSRPSTDTASLLVAVLAALTAFPAAGQGKPGADFPNRPVRVIIPQAAGSGIDIMTRLVAQKLTESWGQQVIVDNRPGANGIIGMETVTKIKPDGYTLCMSFTSALAINPHIYKTLPYDPLRDFAAISQAVTNTIVLIVHPTLPARSVKELVALAKSRPGQLNFGSFGIGNVSHLAGELLRVESGIKMEHVPSKGETAALTSLISGEVALLFAVSSSAAPHIKTGRARLLATGGEKRAPAWPDTPTVIEAGFPNVTVTGWNGLIAPAGTPPEIIQKVQADSARHLLASDLRDRLTAIGADPVGSTPAQFAAFIKSEGEKWARAAKAANVYKSQ